MAQTKAELVEELEAQATKADLVELLQKRLLKDDIAKLLDDDSGATKEELVHKLESLKKDELIEAVSTKLTKDVIEQAVEENRDDEPAEEQDEQETSDEPEDESEDEPEDESEDESAPTGGEERQGGDGRSHEPDWAVRPAPFATGQRVRVDLSGLPMLGIYAGRGASAAGTIVAVDPGERKVQVYLDAVFDGEKEITVPPERLAHEG